MYTSHKPHFILNKKYIWELYESNKPTGLFLMGVLNNK